jgi:ankyrin repeat protein
MPDDLLHQAIEAKATSLVENVLRSSDGVASCGASNEREDAMCVAAACGAIEVMELLAKYGVPIQPATLGATSPLIAAASAYDRAAVQAVIWLLDRGVPVTSVDANGRSVLQRASFAKVSALLVERGADRAQIDWDDMAEEDKETLHRLLGD